MKKLIWITLLLLALTVTVMACTELPEGTDTPSVTTEGGEPTQEPTAEGNATEPPSPTDEPDTDPEAPTDEIPVDSSEDSADQLSKTTFTVTFHVSGHVSGQPASQTVEEGGLATRPTVNQPEDGSSFDGWYTDSSLSADSKFDFSTPITADITLYGCVNPPETTEPETNEPETADPLREDYDIEANLGAVEFGAAGYPGKVIQLMNFENGVLLGDIDLSQYASMIVIYGSDGGAMLGDAGSQVVLTANGSASDASNNPREDVVILGSATLSNPAAGWYAGDREAVITLNTDYSGPVYISHKMASRDGIAVSAIILMKKEPPKPWYNATDVVVHHSFDELRQIAGGAEAGYLKLYAPAANGGLPISLNLNMHDYTGMWHMLTLVHDGGELRVYMDAVHLYTVTVDFELEVGSDPMFIGQIVEGGMEFNGSIGDYALLDEIMTSESIADAYTAVMGELPDTGDDVPGLEGNDVGKAIQTDFAFGDGTTVNLWFNVKGFGDFSILMAKSTKDTGRHFEIYCQGSDLMLYAPAANNNTPIALNLNLAGYVGTWHMLTLVHAEGQIAVYMDGALLHTVEAAFTLEAGEDTLYYGQLVEGIFPFNGQIVNGELLNEALTDDAVAARYSAVFNG